MASPDGAADAAAVKSAHDLLDRAIRIALDAHRGQTYPSPELEPYILHPLRVMFSVKGDWAQIAAVLHDVIEDSEVTLDQLQGEGFPTVVLEAVDRLTKRPNEEYADYIERLASDGVAVQVKVADLEDNLRNNRRLVPTRDVVARIERYERALAHLSGQEL